MNFLRVITAIFGIPLMLLNLFGGVIAAIWLAFLSEWTIIGLGIGIILLGAFVISIALMPALIILVPLHGCSEKNNKFGLYSLGFISSLYTNGVLTAWCISVLYFFAISATNSNYIPILIWAFTVATTPLNYMARKELQSGNESYALVSAMFAQIAFLITAASLLLFNVSVLDLVIIFATVMLINVFIQFQIATDQTRSEAEQQEGAILAAYGKCMEDNKLLPTAFYDESILPYPKYKIAKTLIKTIQTTSNEHLRTSAKAGLFSLACFQKGVGKDPIAEGLMVDGQPLEAFDMDSNDMQNYVAENESHIKEWLKTTEPGGKLNKLKEARRLEWREYAAELGGDKELEALAKHA